MPDSAATEFFLVITPGLEQLAQEELFEKWAKLRRHYQNYFQKSPATKLERGGMTIHCLEAEGWLLNAYLKIPTRILQRFETFRASDVPKLYEKTRKLDWTRFFREGEILVDASSHTSRLSMKNQIENVIQNALRNFREHQPFRKPLMSTPQTIYARVVSDKVLLSVDTSGDPLYQRGYKSKVTEAPLRETLGAAFVYSMIKSVGTTTHLIDPMCGSGTFLSEFFSFNKPTRTRQFSFQNFPCFAKNLPEFKLYDLEVEPLQLLGHDTQEQAISITQESLLKLKAEFQVSRQDLFFTTPNHFENAFVIVNPPFGKRIEVTGSLTQYYQSIVDAIIKAYRPRAIGLLHPADVRGLVTRDTYDWVKSPYAPLSTTTGGLSVQFEILKR